MQSVFPLIFVVLSLIGISDAGYITYKELAGIIPPCTPGFECETVLNSPYSKIGPIPLSALGLLYYGTVLVLSSMLFLEVRFHKLPLLAKTKLAMSSPLDILLFSTTVGALFSLYLVFLMGVVIKAWCSYCLISAATSFALFLLTQWYTYRYSTESGYLYKGMLFAVGSFVYKNLLKKLFFLLDPETIHNLMTSVGAQIGKSGLLRLKISALLEYRHPNLVSTYDGITFPNRVGLSAGFDYNGQLTQSLPAVGFGWHTIGTVTLHPYAGNPKPRLGRYLHSQALLVNKGLKSWGAHAVAAALEQVELKIPTAISIASTNKSFTDTKEQIMDILETFRIFERSRVQHQLYELNISCPNTFGGEPFTTPERLKILLDALEKLKIEKPIYVKMPIDQSEKETLQLLEVIASHTIAGVIFGNLTKDKSNPAVDPADLAHWKTVKGNLSGKPTFDRSNALISLTKKHYRDRFTIVGTGGIFTPEDAQEKLRRGADLIQLITGMIYEGPMLIGRINRALAESKN